MCVCEKEAKRKAIITLDIRRKVIVWCRTDGRRKVGWLRGDSHLAVAGGKIGEEVRGRVSRVCGSVVREHPGRDPFKILRFLVLIFFAA